jgi:hypothetical protein
VLKAKRKRRLRPTALSAAKPQFQVFYLSNLITHLEEKLLQSSPILRSTLFPVLVVERNAHGFYDP